LFSALVCFYPVLLQTVFELLDEFILVRDLLVDWKNVCFPNLPSTLMVLPIWVLCLIVFPGLSMLSCSSSTLGFLLLNPWLTLLELELLIRTMHLLHCAQLSIFFVEPVSKFRLHECEFSIGAFTVD
jgi:hypothetical protein